MGATYGERVRQAIGVLDYRPDQRARQLRSGFAGTVGAAVRNISDHFPYLSEPPASS